MTDLNAAKVHIGPYEWPEQQLRAVDATVTVLLVPLSTSIGVRDYL